MDSNLLMSISYQELYRDLDSDCGQLKVNGNVTKTSWNPSTSTSDQKQDIDSGLFDLTFDHSQLDCLQNDGIDLPIDFLSSRYDSNSFSPLEFYQSIPNILPVSPLQSSNGSPHSAPSYPTSTISSSQPPLPPSLSSSSTPAVSISTYHSLSTSSTSPDQLSSTLVTNETKRLSPDSKSVTLKDTESNRDVQLLRLFESTIFNSLLEDNFVKISLQDESLAVNSGLRLYEYNKYHELAQAADMLHENGNVDIEPNRQPVDRFQMNILHKHTEKLISVLKKLSSFSGLCLDDQIALIKSRFIDLCIVKSLIYMEPETRSLMIKGKRISLERCCMMNDDKFIRLISSINPILRSDPLINLLILLICLLNPSTVNLKSTSEARTEYVTTIYLVQKYLQLRGFTINQANYEVKILICNLEDFLILFNAKKKIKDIARRHLGYTSQLIAEMLDINGQHQYQQQRQSQQL